MAMTCNIDSFLKDKNIPSTKQKLGKVKKFQLEIFAQ